MPTRAQIRQAIKVTLEAGRVFKLQHRHLSSALAHYFVVVNHSPNSDNLLIMCVFSSQIEKVRRRCSVYPNETLVEISPSEYSEISKDSIIDCNSLLNMSIEEFIENTYNGLIDYKESLPAKILLKVKKGLLCSPRHSDEIKQKIIKR